jgi:RNA polymerase-interacting CarD/CdnL/TRCF family regulator
LEAQNYVQAVGSMQIIQSLKGLSASDRDTLNQAFESLKPELRQAADQGNEGAKQALQLLEPPAQP